MNNVKKCVFSFVAATVITVALMGIVAVIFSFFPPNEKLFSFAGMVWRCLSAFFAAFLCSRVMRRKGLVTGVVSAAVYTVVTVLPGIMYFSEISFAGIIILFLTSMFFGAIGGVLGINLK